MLTEAVQQRLEVLFASWFGAAARPAFVFAQAPGRLELAGNHTDHQGGLVISAALDAHIFALAAHNGTGETGVIRVRMEGFGAANIELGEADACEPRLSEAGTSAALVRGMVAARAAAGGRVRGFDMVCVSDLPAGAGVSSSAAFEMLVGVVLRALEGEGGGAGAGTSGTTTSAAAGTNAAGGVADDAAPTELLLTDDERLRLALDGQAAEQRFFGKSCGAQDQIASAFGGAVFMDFSPAPPAPPAVKRISFDPQALPYRLVLIDSRVDHSRYTADYESVAADMARVARFFSCDRLVDLSLTQFRRDEFDVEYTLGTRAWARALHFFEETDRVAKQRRALESGDWPTFSRLARESGESNLTLLCNVTPESAPAGDEDAARPARIMALCGTLLGVRSARRMHGGGFGGSILALVPERKADWFMRRMDRELGYDACRAVSVDARGASAWTAPAELPGRLAWTGPSKYGELEITINLRKPEKDPRAIAAAAAPAAPVAGAACATTAASPAGAASSPERPCDLCREVRTWDAARECAVDGRVRAAGVEFALDGERWMLHFSPYGYYPLHCILLTEVHRPMAITRDCLARLLRCVDRFPFYFVGSNADLPIVGGSILSHDHFQGGGHVFPLMRAKVRAAVSLANFPGISCGIVDWPASTLRLVGSDRDEMVAAATAIAEAWSNFDFARCKILSHTGDVRHSTVTPIAYKHSFASQTRDASPCPADDPYVLDLVLRNNRTTAARPFGLFHPDESLHHIKKENIGLIEIMGLAVLPGRLAREIPAVQSDARTQARVTAAFVKILASTGVFKDTAAGWDGWNAFLGGINGELITD